MANHLVAPAMVLAFAVGCSCADGGVPPDSATALDAAFDSSGASPSDGGIDDGGRVGSRVFTHPGLFHTEADFDRMRERVAAGEQPWLDSWNALLSSGHASLDWTPRPVEIVIRGGEGDNVWILIEDVTRRAYACALRWKISGDDAYADAAVRILDAWSTTLTAVQGNGDRFLAAGLQGWQLANVAEIMRTYSGWSPEGLARFQRMMVTIFYPMNHEFLTTHNGSCISHHWANWDLTAMASMLAIGVLSDREDIYDEAMDYFERGRGNGSILNAVWYVHPGHLGQYQESGRDQGHSTLGVGLLAAFAEMAWNQGDDLYAFDDNRILAVAEYVARSNLIDPDTGAFYEVPYTAYGGRCSGSFALELSTAGQGHSRPIWESLYHHYTNRRGIAAPYTAMMAARLRPEGVGGADQLGRGTLTFTRDPIAEGARPSGLTAIVSGRTVVLSWWGSAYATSYEVRRSATPGGPYATIATVGADTDLTFTDTAVADGDTFYYVVSAGDAGVSDEAIAEVGVRPWVHLTFDEAAGATAADATGNGWDGSLIGEPVWTTGRDGSAIALDGVDDWVLLPEGVVADLSDVTFAAWIRLNASEAWARIFDFGRGTDRYTYLAVRSDTEVGGPRFASTTIAGNGEDRVDGTAALPVDQWVHVAVTLSGTVAILYVDGAEVARNESVRFAPFRVGSTDHWIGRSQWPRDPYLDASIDDFRIYRGAMSAAEVAELAR